MENDTEKSDHELILILKQQIEDLTKHITQTEKNLGVSQQDLHDTSAVSYTHLTLPTILLV